MTALGKLFRTTTFKLTLVYLTVFALFAAFLLGYFALNTRRLITEQITDTVDAEITGLSEQYRLGGIRRLVLIVDARARRPGSSLYLVTTFAGEALAGNVDLAAAGHARQSGLARDRLSPARRERGVRTRRARGAGARVPVARRLPPAGRPRSRGARAALSHRAVGRTLVGRHRHRARARRRAVRHPPRAAPRRCHDRDDAHHHGRRSRRAAAGRRHRRRARPAGGKPQRHARAHRGADERAEGGLRQHRARSQDAADAAAQSRRAGAAHGQERGRISRGAGRRRSRNRTA